MAPAAEDAKLSRGRAFDHGFMTIHLAENGRCSLDPKLSSVPTPGPTTAQLAATSPVRRILGGSSFGLSTTSRFGESTSGTRFMTGSRRQNSPRTCYRTEPNHWLHSVSRTQGSTMTSGSRYHPITWRLAGQDAVPRGDELSPGPKYHVSPLRDPSAADSARAHFGVSNRFAHPNYYVKRSESPGPASGGTRPREFFQDRPCSATMKGSDRGQSCIYPELALQTSPGPIYNPPISTPKPTSLNRDAWK